MAVLPLFWRSAWGQLQRWKIGVFNMNASDKSDGQQREEPALTAKVAKLSADMKQLAEAPKDVIVLDKEGNVLLSGDHDRRFSKVRGYTSIMESIIFLILPAILIK